MDSIMKKLTTPILMALLLAFSASAQEQLISLSFEDAPLEQAVELYREWTGRTIIKQADLGARITLKGRQLTQDEAKQAIETVLAMNGVALIPMGDKFLKVVPIGNARQEGMEIKPFNPDQKYAPADQLITQVIPLRYVVFSDVQPLIQHLVHGYGKIIEMARINSVLITDTSANIARIVELVSMVDQPAEKIEPRIYQLKYAEAATISSKLKELVEAAKTKKGEQTVVSTVRVSPGVIRAPRVTATAAAAAEEDTPTEMVVGDVKIVSDERTNILIVFSKAANFDFFDNIIKVLDIPGDKDKAVVVETVNLEYATAKDIASILNEFIGAAKTTEKTNASGTGTAEGSKTVDEVIQRAAPSTTSAISADTKSAIGRLSDDTKIISDERSNSLILMGRKSDVDAIKQVIATLDVMLEQVMIEAVILNVTLSDDLTTGVQWVYDTGMTAAAKKTYGFDASDLTSASTNFTGNALSYYGAFPGINLQAVITAAKTDGDARVLSTPVVLTTDNTEATITIADEYPVVTSSTTYSSSTGTSSSSYEYTTVGVSLTVTPHINPQRFVLMEIKQSADDINGYLEIDNNNVPIIAKREISATVAVQDRSTIVLGGLVRKSKSDAATKIPLLGDIPLLGWLFSSHSSSDARTELVVLLTPYVLTNAEEAQRETARRFNGSAAKDSEWPHGWSQSPLANDEPAKDEWKNKKDKKGKGKTEEPVIDVVPVEAPAE